MHTQVNPNENIQLVYLFADTTDGNTYYVKAVMRDSITGAILATVLLTQSPTNTRRFTGSIQAPGHNGSSAYYVDITITPYTDAGYITVAVAYPETLDLYQVAYRWSQALGSGGSGGANGVDWSKFNASIAKQFGDSIQEMLKSMPVPADPIDAEALKSSIVKEIKGHLDKYSKTQRLNDRRKQKAQEEKDALERMGEAMDHLNDEPEEEEKEPERLGIGIPEGRTVDEVLFGPESHSGKRQPSAGVVPLHVLERNRAKFGNKKKK